MKSSRVISIKTRMKNKSLKAAIDRLLTMKKEEPQIWHMGISTNKYVFLEGEKTDGMTKNKAIQTGKTLKEILKEKGYKNKVMIIETNNGYHIISNALIEDMGEWKDIYNEIIKMSEATKSDIPIDILHAKLSVKYENTTLRISKQRNNETYNVVCII